MLNNLLAPPPYVYTPSTGRWALLIFGNVSGDVCHWLIPLGRSTDQLPMATAEQDDNFGIIPL